MSDDNAPYQPKYKGFDAEATDRAVATHERAQETRRDAGKGEPNAYVDEGPQEAAERMGSSADEVGDAVERAAKKGKR